MPITDSNRSVPKTLEQNAAELVLDCSKLVVKRLQSGIGMAAEWQQTGTKMAANRHQTGIKQLPEWQQKDSKKIAKRQQTCTRMAAFRCHVIHPLPDAILNIFEQTGEKNG